jgi:hypothetical protein
VAAAGHRQHAPPGEGAAAPRAARPGARARPADDAAAGPDAAACGVVQGGCPRRAQDPRHQLRHPAQAPRRRDRRVRVGRHPLRAVRGLLAQAPAAVRRRDTQPQARALVPPHQGGRGEYLAARTVAATKFLLRATCVLLFLQHIINQQIINNDSSKIYGLQNRPASDVGT